MCQKNLNYYTCQNIKKISACTFYVSVYTKIARPDTQLVEFGSCQNKQKRADDF